MSDTDKLFLQTANRSMQSALGIFTGAVYEDDGDDVSDVYEEEDFPVRNCKEKKREKKRKKTPAEKTEGGNRHVG